MKQRLQIGVVGYAGIEEYPAKDSPDPAVYAAAEEVGRLLASMGLTVVTGGKGGVMEAAARGAKQAGGITVGIVSGAARGTANDYTDVEIPTGMASAGFDEVLLVGMCDALIVICGGAGTLEEIVLAYRNRKPIVILAGTGGWADAVADTYLDERKSQKTTVASMPAEAVKAAVTLARKSYA